MKIFLLQDVKKLGKAGEIVDVSDGYAKNFIMPQKLGKEATKEIINEWKIKKGAEAKHKEDDRQAAIALAKDLSAKSVTLKIKGGDNGKLFGSVTSKDIADAINKEHGLTIDKKKILLKDAIKTAGCYHVDVKLHPEATAKILVTVETL